MNMFKKRIEPAFSVPLLPVTLIGSAVCGLFYFLIKIKILTSEQLLRYAMCHWVAIASVWLFCIAITALLAKWWLTRQQLRLADEASAALRSILDSRQDLEGATQRDGLQLSRWFDTLWRSQKRVVHQSWFGQRVSEFITRQLQRQSAKRLDDDLHALAERDADSQHASHAMVRIICWAMPMLGFLGTVLGISDTLGHMDAQALASGSQEAMNDLTGGLYVAFDTTAVGLVLTMIAIFIQFAIQRTEMRLLTKIDTEVASSMQECLSIPDEPSPVGDVEASLRVIANGIITSVQTLVQTQSEIWRDTINEAHRHWQSLSQDVTETAKTGLLDALGQSLTEHRAAIRSQALELVELQADGADKIDARLQQWQTTISEQARLALRQQQEMSKHAEMLQKLLDSSQLVGAMQGPIEATLNRLTNVDRFHDAAVCLTEAVAVLGTQMERYGYLGRQPVRRRSPEESTAKPAPETLPMVPSMEAGTSAGPSAGTNAGQSVGSSAGPGATLAESPAALWKRKAG